MAVLSTLAVLIGAPLAAAMAVSPRPTVPNSFSPSSSGAPITGPTFDKPLSTPDSVPEAGQQRAVELMRSGALFRYTPGVLSETALAEEAMVDYTGFKYVVGFNSCGSALFIALKCLGVTPEDSVLCNAFSFTAVPSAIHHTMATPVYVESNDGFVMDMDDLEKKITPDTKYAPQAPGRAQRGGSGSEPLGTQPRGSARRVLLARGAMAPSPSPAPGPTLALACARGRPRRPPAPRSSCLCGPAQVPDADSHAGQGGRHDARLRDRRKAQPAGG